MHGILSGLSLNVRYSMTEVVAQKAAIQRIMRSRPVSGQRQQSVYGPTAIDLDPVSIRSRRLPMPIGRHPADLSLG
jgi:hypothetical protein